MKKFLAYTLCFFFALSGYAQPWRVIAESKIADPNFYDIQQAFTEYYDNYSRTVNDVFGKKTGFYEASEVPGFFQYKRWEYYWEQRVYPTGEFPNSADIFHEWEQLHQQLEEDNTRAAGNWTLMGPINAVPTNNGGVGRINCVRFNPLNANVVWVGAPAGGLWKSTNGGTNWTTNTDNLPVIGISDIAINPQDTSMVYIATGDADASDTYSVGVLKSTNSGATWSATGLNWNIDQVRTIRRLLINPSDPNILIAATSNGIYRTTDAGANWTQVKTGSYKDMEFMPGNTSIVYAVSNYQFFKSTNGGATWGSPIVGTGFPPSNVGRTAIAVTPANPNVVYALCSASDDGFRGFYKSIDAGANWTTQSTSPNILGWSNDGSDVGGQGWYDLTVAASPADQNTVLVGGIRIWRSTDGGTNWILSAYNSAHADVHDINFANSSSTIVYAGTDGGVFYNNSAGSVPWTNKSASLQIQQSYKLSNSQTVSTTVVTGTQDNGTNKIASSAMSKILGGDGMECIVDYTNANVIYGELYYGDLNKSTNGGGNWSGIAPDNNGAWVTPYVMHSSNPSILYAGYTTVYKTTNGGTSWNSGTNSIGVQYRSMAVAPSNGNYVYAATLSAIYRSTDGAQTWTSISSGLPGSESITYITVKYNDPQTLWITYSGYSSTLKVYKSTDAGATWTNVTATGLPNVPANCIVNEPNNTTDALYVGTDLGVFYRNNNMPNWIPYMSGLPNVPVYELEVQVSAAKIRAATYGRGIWQSDLAVGNVGTEELPKEADVFMVYPNPSNGTLFIQMDTHKEIDMIQVYDVLGEKVIEMHNPTATGNLVQLDMSTFTNGVYSVAITNGSQRTIKKISLVR